MSGKVREGEINFDSITHFHNPVRFTFIFSLFHLPEFSKTKLNTHTGKNTKYTFVLSHWSHDITHVYPCLKGHSLDMMVYLAITCAVMSKRSSWDMTIAHYGNSTWTRCTCFTLHNQIFIISWKNISYISEGYWQETCFETLLVLRLLPWQKIILLQRKATSCIHSGRSSCTQRVVYALNQTTSLLNFHKVSWNWKANDSTMIINTKINLGFRYSSWCRIIRLKTNIKLFITVQVNM